MPEKAKHRQQQGQRQHRCEHFLCQGNEVTVMPGAEQTQYLEALCTWLVMFASIIGEKGEVGGN